MKTIQINPQKVGKTTEDFKNLIDKINQGRSASHDSEVALLCQQACPDHYNDESGKEYYYEADGTSLKQMYVDDETGDEQIEWGIGGVSIDGFSGNLQVELHS